MRTFWLIVFLSALLTSCAKSSEKITLVLQSQPSQAELFAAKEIRGNHKVLLYF